MHATETRSKQVNSGVGYGMLWFLPSALFFRLGFSIGIFLGFTSSSNLVIRDGLSREPNNARVYFQALTRSTLNYAPSYDDLSHKLNHVSSIICTKILMAFRGPLIILIFLTTLIR